MKLKHLSALLIIPGVILCGGVAQAGSLNFTFSFTNTTGLVSGTVTGEILGLSDNSTGPAADVLIESWPAALNADLFASYTPPIDTNSWPTATAPNTFTVSGGQITDANFGIDDGDFDFLTLGTGCNFLGSCGNAFGNWLTATWVGSDSGDVTFTPLSATPEPSTFAFLALAGIALVVWGRSRHFARNGKRILFSS